MNRKIIFIFLLVLIFFGLILYLTQFISKPTINQAVLPPKIELNNKLSESIPKIDKFYAPVLAYHHIADTWPQNSYYVSPKIFEKQMQWLKDNNYTVISFEQLYGAMRQNNTLPEKPVVITFDDGNRDQYTNAFPILKKFGYTATFFIKINNVGTSGMKWSQIKELSSAGMTIGSHTVNHDNLALMSQKTLDYELKESKRILEKNLNVPIKFLCYPGGMTSEKVVTATKNAGYLAAATTKHKVYQEIKNENSVYLIPRIHIDDEMPSFIQWVQGKNLN